MPRRKLLTQTKSELTEIGNLLAQLSQAVLLLAEREHIGFTDENYPKRTGKQIARRMEQERKVSVAEVVKYALELPVVTDDMKVKKPRREHQAIAELERMYLDGERDQTSSPGDRDQGPGDANTDEQLFTRLDTGADSPG
jgi:hypothetical protein